MMCEIFKKEDTSKTLNASEAIAKGCAMMSAMNSVHFKVAEY